MWNSFESYKSTGKKGKKKEVRRCAHLVSILSQASCFKKAALEGCSVPDLGLRVSAVQTSIFRK